MRSVAAAILALCALSACELVGRPKQPPEEFALIAVRALTMNDWGAYVPLCAQQAERAATIGGANLSERLSPFEQEQKRAEFDAVVRSRRLRPHAVDIYRAVVTAKEPDRWVVQVLDGNGDPIGVELVLGRIGENYELLHASLR